MLPVRDVGGKTEVDDAAPRARARDAWVRAARSHFLEGYRLCEQEPSAAVRALRLFLEAWTFATCIELLADNFDFRADERNREKRGELLNSLGNHIGRSQKIAAGTIKDFGDLFSHSQGTDVPASPAQARASLAAAADLFRFLQLTVLTSGIDAELSTALSDVERPSRRSVDAPAPVVGAPVILARRPRPRPWLPLIAVGVIIAAVVVLVAALRSPTAGATGTAQAPSAPTSAGPAISQASPIDPLAAAKEYERAIASRDVGQILARHHFPTRWFDAKSPVSEEELRKILVDAFNKRSSQASYFEDCEVRPPGNAVLCQVRLDPPSERNASRIPTCLVLDDDGRVTQRTQISNNQPTCPPRP